MATDDPSTPDLKLLARAVTVSSMSCTMKQHMYYGPPTTSLLPTGGVWRTFNLQACRPLA